MAEQQRRSTPTILAVDGATAVLAAVAGLLAIVGPLRLVIGGTPITFGWGHAAFLALACAAIRHAAVPRPSLAATVASWPQALVRRPALADALLAFVTTRLPVLAVGLVAVATLGLPPEAPPSRSPLASLASRWDAQWYAGIADSGYAWQYRFDRQQNLAFFPALPVLMRAAGEVTGVFASGIPESRRIDRLAWCGLVMALIAFVVAARAFSTLARDAIGQERARDAVLLLAAAPFALFFSAAYTEALFLLAALGAWSAWRRDAFAAAVAWGLLAGLSRPNGCFLSLPLGLLAMGWRDIGRPVSRAHGGPVARRLVMAAAPGVGMLIYTAYLYYLTGVWFAWSRLHEAWGRVFGAESLEVTGWGARSLAAAVVAHPYTAINAVGLVIVLAALRPLWRLSPAWGLFVAVNVMVPLLAGGLLSMGRITSTMFPVFLALAVALPPRAVPGVLSGFALAQGLFAALFYTWRGVF